MCSAHLRHQNSWSFSNHCQLDAHLSSWMTRSKKKRSEGKRSMAIAFNGESFVKGSTLQSMRQNANEMCFK